jgi:hypothetical protein
MKAAPQVANAAANAPQAVAASRTQRPAPGPLFAQGPILRRRCACGGSAGASGECEDCREKRPTLSRRADAATPAAGATAAPAAVHEVLGRSGQPLAAATRRLMESGFGTDFGHVRVHADAAAARAASSVGALAWTVGSHIAFGAQRFRPDTAAGIELLAHELAHTLQQPHAALPAGAEIPIGATSDPAEAHADALAERALRGRDAHRAQAPGRAPVLRRQTLEPQARGGPPQRATLELPQRGEDQVRMHVFRYLCDCQGRDVTRTRLRGDFNPPGVVFQFCRGAVSGDIRGTLRPSSLTTGAATVTAGVNVAPGEGRPGVRVEVEGEARNTGTEPEIVGRGRARVDVGGGTSIVGTGEVTGGLESGRVRGSAGGGVRLPGGTTITGQVTGLGGDVGGTIGIGGTLGGPTVSREVCRECVCPTAYECIEDVLPRSYEEEEQYDVTDTSRLRYYFRLNSTDDTRNPALRAESRRLVGELTRLLGEGWTVAAVNGYASPEAEEAAVNRSLSEARARRLHEVLAPQLPVGTALPQPEGRGELLGARATILPGATIADAVADAGFTSPEEASVLLVGDEVLTPDLAAQFLDLFSRLPEPGDRLALFGVAEGTPLAAQLLAAIEVFVRARGRGHRPWERIFEYLRFANVEVSRVRSVTRTETRTTRGSVRQTGETVCRSFAERAEREGRFGAAQRPPAAADCPTRLPRNPERFANLCHYD